MIAPATNRKMEAAARSAALCPAAFCRMIPDFRTHGFRPFRANTFHPFGRQMQNDNIQTVRTATAN